MMIMSHKMILKIMTLCIKKWQLKLASFIKDARTEWVKSFCQIYGSLKFESRKKSEIHYVCPYGSYKHSLFILVYHSNLSKTYFNIIKTIIMVICLTLNGRSGKCC